MSPRVQSWIDSNVNKRVKVSVHNVMSKTDKYLFASEKIHVFKSIPDFQGIEH